MIRAVLLALAGLALMAGAGRPATAASIAFDIKFIASDFTPNPVGPSPAVAQGQFHLTFDPTIDIPSSTAITLDSVNVPFASTVAFQFDTAKDNLTIGGLEDGVRNVDTAKADFALVIHGIAAGTPSFLSFVYGPFVAGSGSVTVLSTPVATTPIPAALPLFFAALGGLGLLGWRRKRAAA